MPNNSIFPASPNERQTVLLGHSIVNGIGIIAVTSMHIWGSLSAEWAVGAVGGICGLWGASTRKGAPGAAPGASGALFAAVGSVLSRMQS